MKRFDLVRWPRFFYAFMDIIDTLNLELFALVPAECITRSRLGFAYELVATALLPVGILSGVLLLSWVARCVTFQGRTSKVWWVRFNELEESIIQEKASLSDVRHWGCGVLPVEP